MCGKQVTIYNGDSVITPDMFVIAGRRVVDLSGVTALDQAIAIGRSELEGLPPEAPVALISVQGARGHMNEPARRAAAWNRQFRLACCCCDADPQYRRIEPSAAVPALVEAALEDGRSLAVGGAQ